MSEAPARPGKDRRAVLHPAPAPVSAEEARPLRRVAVVGGGIAGIAAACALAERGVAVEIIEREAQLGGRVRSWPIDVPAGDNGDSGAAAPAGATMSRGFHAFFRQYYTLRALLRRVDPELSHLIPLEDYPLVHSDGYADSFSGLPTTPPLSVAAFALRSPSFTAREVAGVHLGRAVRLLAVDFPRTFATYDGVSAAEVLDRLRFPRKARHLALEVFARSFFADPRDFSGGELVAMFHAYFMGSAEGLVFDVPDGDYDRVLWAPLRRYLEGLGVEVRTGTTVMDIQQAGTGLRLCVADTVAAERAGGEVTWHEVLCDAAVIATDRRPLQALVEGAPWWGGPRWRALVAEQEMAPPFAVWRLWLDTPVADGTPPFVGTAAYGLLDNVSIVEQFEEEAADWVAATGGSVVELHAYALDPTLPEEAVRADLRAQLARLHPELDGARVLHEEWLVRQDCGLISTAPWEVRPGVVTPDPRLVLAGDGVRCELPVALMERAAVTGFQAANALLADAGLEGHDLWSVPMTGGLGRVAGPLALVGDVVTAAGDRVRSAYGLLRR